MNNVSAYGGITFNNKEINTVFFVLFLVNYLFPGFDISAWKPGILIDPDSFFRDLGGNKNLEPVISIADIKDFLIIPWSDVTLFWKYPYLKKIYIFRRWIVLLWMG